MSDAITDRDPADETAGTHDIDFGWSIRILDEEKRTMGEVPCRIRILTVFPMEIAVVGDIRLSENKGQIRTGVAAYALVHHSVFGPVRCARLP